MVCITVVHAGNGEFDVMPSAKYEGDIIITTLTPFNPERASITSVGGGNITPISDAAFHRLRIYYVSRRECWKAQPLARCH